MLDRDYWQVDKVMMCAEVRKMTGPQHRGVAEKSIPHSYVREIIDTAKLDRLEETVIVAEQFV